jgi:hypothetical protein
MENIKQRVICYSNILKRGSNGHNNYIAIMKHMFCEKVHIFKNIYFGLIIIHNYIIRHLVL